jgi:hypothetical protein
MLSFLDGCVDYQQRFESHAARLFINEENGWDVQFYGVSWADGRGNPRSCSIEDSRQLEDLMQGLEGTHSVQYLSVSQIKRRQTSRSPLLTFLMNSIVRQKYTWDRFIVSSAGFSRILGGDDAYGPFLDFVTAFGQKQNLHDEGLGGFNYRINSRDGKHLSYGKSP